MRLRHSYNIKCSNNALKLKEKELGKEIIAMKRYINTSGRNLDIYADNNFTTKVGALYRDSACS